MIVLKVYIKDTVYWRKWPSIMSKYLWIVACSYSLSSELIALKAAHAINGNIKSKSDNENIGL